MATIESWRHPPVHMYLAKPCALGDELFTQHAAAIRRANQGDTTTAWLQQRGMPEQPFAILPRGCQRRVDAVATQGPRRSLAYRQHDRPRLQWRQRGGVTHGGRTGEDQQLIHQCSTQAGTGIDAIGHTAQSQAGQQ